MFGKIINDIKKQKAIRSALRQLKRDMKAADKEIMTCADFHIYPGDIPDEW